MNARSCHNSRSRFYSRSRIYHWIAFTGLHGHVTWHPVRTRALSLQTRSTRWSVEPCTSWPFYCSNCSSVRDKHTSSLLRVIWFAQETVRIAPPPHPSHTHPLTYFQLQPIKLLQKCRLWQEDYAMFVGLFLCTWTLNCTFCVCVCGEREGADRETEREQTKHKRQAPNEAIFFRLVNKPDLRRRYKNNLLNWEAPNDSNDQRFNLTQFQKVTRWVIAVLSSFSATAVDETAWFSKFSNHAQPCCVVEVNANCVLK